MANATFSAPMGTQRGIFNVGVSFSDDSAVPLRVTMLEKTDFNLRSLTENGAKDVDFSIAGAEPNSDFNLAFALPTAQEGSFEISFTGMVTPGGSSTPEAVMVDAVVIYYDTTSDVTAEFGEVDYRDGGVIIVPITFAEAVVAPSKTVFPVSFVSGDVLTGMEYILLGSGTEFELYFFIQEGRKGSFKVGALGDVLKVSSDVWDNVEVVAPKLVPYGYNV